MSENYSPPVQAVLGLTQRETQEIKLGWDSDYLAADLISGITEIKAALGLRSDLELLHRRIEGGVYDAKDRPSCSLEMVEMAIRVMLRGERLPRTEREEEPEP